MWIKSNLNPYNQDTDDCVIRAIAAATGKGWETVYMSLSVLGCDMGRMPDNNTVWGKYLRSLGWHRGAIPDVCPDCYTVSSFSADHPFGDYICYISFIGNSRKIGRRKNVNSHCIIPVWINGIVI